MSSKTHHAVVHVGYNTTKQVPYWFSSYTANFILLTVLSVSYYIHYWCQITFFRFDMMNYNQLTKVCIFLHKLDVGNKKLPLIHTDWQDWHGDDTSGDGGSDASRHR